MNKRTIFSIIMLIIAIIVLIIGIIFMRNSDEFNKSEKYAVKYDIVYDVNKMELVEERNTFFTLEKIIKDIFNNIQNEKYDDIFYLFNETYIEDMNKENILKDFNDINKYMREIDYKISDTSKLLYKVYKIKEDTYNCLIDLNGVIQYIAIYLNEKKETYEIYDMVLVVDNI